MRNVAPSTNARTFINAVIPGFPSGNSLSEMSADIGGPLAPWKLSAILSSLVFDWLVRTRIGGSNLSWSFIQDVPVPKPESHATDHIGTLAFLLGSTSHAFALEWLAARQRIRSGGARAWPITPHERLRLRCILDAIVAVLYCLDRDDFAWILKDCDHPKARLSEKAFCRGFDPKGFWRVDKTENPELRHTVLSLSAFDDLHAAIVAAGNRDTGIQAFCDQNEGDGWMLPESLCLADLGLTRTVDIGDYDERARTPQPVSSRLGERFLDWQLAQTPEESWAECERHARAIMERLPAPAAEPDTEPAAPQPRLPGMEH